MNTVPCKAGDFAHPHGAGKGQVDCDIQLSIRAVVESISNTKIQKFGMLTITGIIGGIFFYLIGYGWIGLLGWVLGGILSDVVLKIGGYQKFKVTVLSYACFCLGIMGCPANLWFAGEAYWENIHTSMGDQYANTLQSLMPSWMMYVGFALLFVGGILGALLGHKMLKKHFERAGIV